MGVECKKIADGYIRELRGIVPSDDNGGNEKIRKFKFELIREQMQILNNSLQDKEVDEVKLFEGIQKLYWEVIEYFDSSIVLNK